MHRHAGGIASVINETAAALAVLKRFWDHLQPGGRLILDIDSIESIGDETSSTRSWAVGSGELLTMTSHRAEIDYVKQTTLSHLRYESWRRGGCCRDLDLFHLRWWGADELAFALWETGFVDVVVSGDLLHEQQPRNGVRIISFEARRSES